MVSSEPVQVLVDRLLETAENTSDAGEEMCLHQRAQIALLRALLDEITGLRADLARSDGERRSIQTSRGVPDGSDGGEPPIRPPRTGRASHRY